MDVKVMTHIDLSFETHEYDYLLEEINLYMDENSSPFVNSLEEMLDDLDRNYRKLSDFSIRTAMDFQFAGEFFKDIEEDIEEIDSEDYPLLRNLLATIANSI